LRRGLRRAALSTIAPIAFLAAVEGSLAALGVGSPPPFLIPLEADPSLLVRSPRFREFWATPPAPIRAVKPANGFRVAVLGESTVAGYAFFIATLCDWLSARLSDLLPDRTCEVINGGVVGWTLHRLLDVLDACLEQRPDVVVIMVGHNEERSADNVLRLRDRAQHPLRAALFDWLLDLRLSRVLSEWVPKTVRWFPADEGRDVPRIGPEAALLRSEYRRNLARAAEAVRRSGAALVMTTMPRNARELGPGGSTFSPALPAAQRDALRSKLAETTALLEKGEAAAALALADAVLAVDATPADAHYARGRALEKLGRCEEARAAYLEAGERDAWPSRARAWVQETIREVAKEKGGTLVDLVRKFDEHGACGVAGFEWLGDDVHPNLDGHRVIADLIVDALADAGIPAPRAQWRFDRLRSDDEVRRSFGTEDIQSFSVNRALGYAKLFEALMLPPSLPDDRRKKAALACEQLLQAHALVPTDTRVSILLGVAEIFAGSTEEGGGRLRKALSGDPVAAREFARVVAASPGLRDALLAAGVDVAALAR
jgi:lysophospholipase L1-like esterase